MDSLDIKEVILNKRDPQKVSNSFIEQYFSQYDLDIDIIL